METPYSAMYTIYNYCVERAQEMAALLCDMKPCCGGFLVQN